MKGPYHEGQKVQVCALSTLKKRKHALSMLPGMLAKAGEIGEVAGDDTEAPGVLFADGRAYFMPDTALTKVRK